MNNSLKGRISFLLKGEEDSVDISEQPSQPVPDEESSLQLQVNALNNFT